MSDSETASDSAPLPPPILPPDSIRVSDSPVRQLSKKKKKKKMNFCLFLYVFFEMHSSFHMKVFF